MSRNDEALIALLDHLEKEPDARLVLDVETGGKFTCSYEFRRFTIHSGPHALLQDACEDIFLQVFPPKPEPPSPVPA